ncbi:uncharacterized protein TNCV_2992011 [Trichonephila clavipes]|nr:uncharacterized protein TNCV_2992011 [Trichonephila clavipes]
MPGKRVRRHFSQLSEFERGLIIGRKTEGCTVLLARWIVRSVPLEIVGSSGHEKVPTREKPATRGLLTTDHVILNHGQVTWPTPELAPPLLTTTPHQREDVSALDRFNVHRCPTRRVFSGTGLEPVTKQATVRYLYHSATAATRNIGNCVYSGAKPDQCGMSQIGKRLCLVMNPGLFWGQMITVYWCGGTLPMIDRPLIVMRGTLTRQRYVDDILRPYVGRFLNGLSGAILQQDNPLPHTARVSQDFLHHFQTLPWPARSPDFNPVEPVWIS